MTFEKVLQVFDDIIENDPMYEIVTTSHGYALLEWCAPQEEWSNIEHLPTPEVMLEKLLDALFCTKTDSSWCCPRLPRPT